MVLKLKRESTIIMGSSCPSEISDEILTLAQQLSRLHGRVRVAAESGGVHLYIASPICLSQFGPDELLPSKMHLAVNADKYLGRPPYETPNDFAAMCMKTGEIYKISELLQYSDLEARGFHDAQHQVNVQQKISYLEPDANGNEIPRAPGSEVSLDLLPPDHAAVVYLKSRDFTVRQLVDQFDATFCTDTDAYSYYRNLGLGFQQSPRHRLIFNIMIKGVRRGWQARILEMKINGSDNRKYHWCYNTSRPEWTPVKVLNESTDTWDLMPGLDKWDPAKYMTGPGTRRNLCLMGYDAALSSNKSWLGITEGPLDAARLGPPFCAALGKSFSEAQADLCKSYDQVVIAYQNDTAGDDFKSSVVRRLRDIGISVIPMAPPGEYNDFGDMSQEDADNFFDSIKIKNSLE